MTAAHHSIATLERRALPAGGAWSPTRLIRGSMWLHAATVAALPFVSSEWPWALGVLAGNHALLGAAGMVPRSRLLGPNLVRLPEASARRGEVALTFDDGPDPEVTPAILDLLDRHGVRASFFCIAERAERHAELTRDIVRRGHSVENHSWRHRFTFACRGGGALGREVDRAQRLLAAVTGAAPRFFRAPLGIRNPLLAPVLARADLAYVSWSRRGFDSVCGDPAAVLRRLTRGLRAGDILMLHDGDTARTRENLPVSLAVLPGLLERMRAQGLMPVSLPAAFGKSAEILGPAVAHELES